MQLSSVSYPPALSPYAAEAIEPRPGHFLALVGRAYYWPRPLLNTAYNILEGNFCTATRPYNVLTPTDTVNGLVCRGRVNGLTAVNMGVQTNFFPPSRSWLARMSYEADCLSGAPTFQMLPPPMAFCVTDCKLDF